MPTGNQWGAVAAGLAGGLRDLLNGQIEGLGEELDGPIRDASVRMQFAAKRNRPELVEEIRDELEMAVLERQLEIKYAGSDLFSSFLMVGLTGLFNGAVAGIAGVRV